MITVSGWQLLFSIRMQPVVACSTDRCIEQLGHFSSDVEARVLFVPHPKNLGRACSAHMVRSTQKISSQREWRNHTTGGIFASTSLTMTTVDILTSGWTNQKGFD